MTPLHIRIAIHYLCHPYPYAENEPEHRYSIATREYTRQLVRAGMLVPREVVEDDKNTAEYEPTTGLRMYIDALCSVPLPIPARAWIHPMLPPRAD
jgi:hypothetical protein